MKHEQDKQGYYTLRYIFNRCKDRLSNKIREDKSDIKRKIYWRVFRKVVYTYFEEVFHDIIYKSYDVPLPKKLGRLIGMKRLCTQFNPQVRYTRVDKDGNKERIERDVNVNETDGYAFFIYWDRPQKYQRYKIYTSPRWKAEMTKQYKKGRDYAEYKPK